MTLTKDERNEVAGRARVFAALLALFAALLEAGEDLSVAGAPLGPLQGRKLADELVSRVLSETVD